MAELLSGLLMPPADGGYHIEVDDLPDMVDEDCIHYEIIDICGGLVEVQQAKSSDKPADQTVHFIHLSVKEFLQMTIGIKERLSLSAEDK